MNLEFERNYLYLLPSHSSSDMLQGQNRLGFLTSAVDAHHVDAEADCHYRIKNHRLQVDEVEWNTWAESVEHRLLLFLAENNTTDW